MGRRLRALGSALILAAIWVASGAAAEREFIEMTQMSETQRTVVSESGVVLIATVADARLDIAERDYRRARRELRKARRLCDQIAKASPSLRLKNSLLDATRSIEPDAAQPTERLAPIYRELDIYETVQDASEIRVHVDAASGKLADGAVEVAIAHLQEASAKVVFFEVDLPIDHTTQQLRLAHDDFERGDARLADSRLRKIQGSLQNFAKVASLDVDDAEFVDVAAEPPAD